MTLFKRILSTLLLTTICCVATAQNGTNSPYSRFGFGTLSDQSQGFNKGMGGLSMGMRGGTMLNTQNPASYSTLDSLNLVFDVGVSLQNGNFSYGGTKKNARNSTLDYINAGFRLHKNLGISVGFKPFSKVGYDFSATSTVGTNSFTGEKITVKNVYNGDGGLHQLYLGLGWMPVRNFSIGMNASYLWGNYTHAVAQMYYEGSTPSTSISTLNRTYSADVRTYKLDFGAQYTFNLNPKNNVTLGATFGLGHDVDNTAHYTNFMSGSDTITQSISKAFQLPMSVGAGFAWRHNNRLTVGADYTLQKWADCRFPALNASNVYASDKGVFADYHKVTLGAEYVPSAVSRKYADRIRYRVGGYYATPYAQVNGEDGAKEFCVSAGVGLPILPRNLMNNKNVLNLSFQWVRTTSPSNLLPKENYLRLNIGLTFNEEWFKKWKVN